MTKNNYTHIVYLIDESGSMQPLKENTQKNYSNFIREQKQISGECTFSLYRIQNTENFLIPFTLNHVCNIGEIRTKFEATPASILSVSEEILYMPNGSTPLLDTIGKAIDETGKYLSNLKEENRPSKVIFIIDTDGGENSSVEYDHEKIRKMIQHQQDVYSWSFLFFGANQDSFTVGSNLGINTRGISNYIHTSHGNDIKYKGMSYSCASLRSDPNQSFNLAEVMNNIEQSDKKIT